MKQNSNSREDIAQGVDDAELELMLDDAYDVPAVPRSLLKRIDRGVEQEWGISPKLAQREQMTLGSEVDHRSSSLRIWSVAASITLIVVALVAFQSSASASYSWSRMLEALSGAPMAQIAGPDGTTRWMSASRAVVGQRSADKSRLLDFGHGVVLEHDADAEQVTRRSFVSATSLSQQEAVVVAFLLDNVTEQGESLRQSDLRVIDQSWSVAGDDVRLRFQLESEAATVELDVTVDRDTHLPKVLELARDDSPHSRVAISYPQTDPTTLLARDFPSNLPVVDALAQAATIAAANAPPRREVQADVVAITENEAATDTPAFGAASLQWPPVKPTNLSSSEAIARINTTITALWREHDIQPADVASDEELLRRIYLDLVGRTPSVSEVRAYLDDDATDRYVKLVDTLLASRDHATHFATVWRTYLIPEGLDLSKFGGPQSFEKWIGRKFIDQVPYDEIVRQLLLAEGRLTQSGPLLFYAAAKLDPDQLATRSSRVFLGMRLDCAQCHDDHFEPWLQEDFWGYAAFFAQISRPKGVLNNVSTVMRVRDVGRGEVTLPETEDIVLPRFLDGAPIDDDADSVARRQQLASWLTGNDNPFFARATANRVWGQLFGKGIVDPIDGFGTQHKPVSQELLDQLASHFIGSDYDLRELVRSIVLSRAYRLSSGAQTPDPKRREFFAQMNVKLLTAEQMYDCITVASMLGTAESGTGFNLDRVGNLDRDQFLQQFRAPPGRSTEYQSGIPQALTLMNGGLINGATGLASSGLLKSLEIPLISNKDRVEILYLATLSRRPTSSEQQLLGEYISEETSGKQLSESLADVLWALLNSAEFTMNH